MSEDLTGGAPAPAEPTPAPQSQTATPANASTPQTPQTPAALEPAIPSAKEQSLHDALSDVWDKAQDTGEEDASPSVAAPLRDEHGRFASTNPAPPITDPTPATAVPETDPSVQPVQTAPVHQAPPSWSGEQKAQTWAKLPPDAQEYILQRESEAHRAITQQGQRLKQYEPFDQLVQANRDHFERNRISPAESFQTLLAAQSALETDPVNGLVQIGLSYGIDLRPLLGLEGGLPNGGADPMVRTLQARLQQLEGQVSQQTRAQAEAAERAAETERTELQKTIETFSKDKPHFETVKPTMAALLRSGQAETLDAAYDMAIHAVPSIRSRILAEQGQDQRRADDERRMADVTRAKRASAVNTRSIPASANPRSIDDELNALAAKHYGR